MYHSLVLPYFDYCSLVWNNCSQTLKDKVQRLQNRAARVITGDNYDIRSSDIFNKLGWNNLQDRRNSQTMNYVTNFRLFWKNALKGLMKCFMLLVMIIIIFGAMTWCWDYQNQIQMPWEDPEFLDFSGIGNVRTVGAQALLQ
jgi:hypothetical protein